MRYKLFECPAAKGRSGPDLRTRINLQYLWERKEDRHNIIYPDETFYISYDKQ